MQPKILKKIHTSFKFGEQLMGAINVKIKNSDFAI